MTNDAQREKEIALNAEKLLTMALRQTISTLGFKNHVSQEGGKRISDAKGVAKYKLGSAKFNSVRYYFNSLNMEMPKYGYIQHHGAIGIRSGTFRERNKPKNTSYSVRTHSWNLPEKDFIGKAINQSGVIGYVLESVTAARGEEIFVRMKNFFENE